MFYYICLFLPFLFLYTVGVRCFFGVRGKSYRCIINQIHIVTGVNYIAWSLISQKWGVNKNIIWNSTSVLILFYILNCWRGVYYFRNVKMCLDIFFFCDEKEVNYKSVFCFLLLNKQHLRYVFKFLLTKKIDIKI